MTAPDRAIRSWIGSNRSDAMPRVGIASAECWRADKKQRLTILISADAEITATSSPVRKRASGAQNCARAVSDCPMSLSQSSPERLSRSRDKAGSPSQVRSSRLRTRHRSRSGSPRKVAALSIAPNGPGTQGRPRRTRRGPGSKNSKRSCWGNSTRCLVPKDFNTANVAV